MARVWSTEAEPHRILKLDDDPQRGEDVRALQVACNKRLAARGLTTKVKVDGIYGHSTALAFDQVATALGALPITIKPEAFPIGAQRMIRYPGRRNKDQLDRAADWMEHWRKHIDAEDARRHGPQAEAHSPSGLGAVDARKAVDIMLESFSLLYHHAPAVHYTQGAQRWQGIQTKRKAYLGKYPIWCDCSSAYSWTGWNAADHFNLPDIFNGQHFTAGFTGTLLVHGVGISKPVPGCAIIYGKAWPGVHVAEYAGDGKAFSHGSEAAPFFVDYDYRADILAFRKFF